MKHLRLWYILLLFFGLVSLVSLVGCTRSQRLAGSAKSSKKSGQSFFKQSGAHSAGMDAATIDAAVESPTRKFVGGKSEDEILDQLLNKKIKLLLPIGSTSVAFRVGFQQDGIEAAYKPRTYESPRGFAAEVAAYRIGRALDFDNIPPVTVRTLSKVIVKAHLDEKYQSQWDDFRRAISWDGDGLVEGSAIYWVPGLKSIDLDHRQKIREWMRWLKHDGELPVDKIQLARDLSRMLCFDYLIANTDRFSGDNVQVDETASRVIVRDHNLAFASPLYERLHERILNLLLRVERYSRSYLDMLQAFDEPTLREALGPASVLTDEQIRDVMDRREAILSRAAALVELYGKDQVLYFE